MLRIILILVQASDRWLDWDLLLWLSPDNSSYILPISNYVASLKRCRIEHGTGLLGQELRGFKCCFKAKSLPCDHNKWVGSERVFVALLQIRTLTFQP